MWSAGVAAHAEWLGAVVLGDVVLDLVGVEPPVRPIVGLTV